MATKDNNKPKRRRGSGEGSIGRYKDGRWVARVNLGYEPKRDRNGQLVYKDGRLQRVRKRKVVYASTRKEAAEALKQLLAQQQQGVNIAPERQTVEQFLEHWLTNTVSPKAAPGTLAKYSQWVRLYITPAIGRIVLSKLTPQHVQGLLRQVQDHGIAPGTIRRMLGMLRVALNVAVKFDLVTRNVAKLVDPPREEPYEPRVLTFEEAEGFLMAAADDRLHALWLAALVLGLRRSELLGLRWHDVDLEAGVLRVTVQLLPVNGKLEFRPPKTRRSRRTLPIPPVVVNALRQHRARQLYEQMLAGSRWKEHDLVFPTTIGTPMYASHVTEALNRLLEQAKLPHITLHSLRRSTATFLAALGVELKTAMELLGHTNPQMTLHYTHVLDERKQQAMERIGKRFEGKEEAL